MNIPSEKNFALSKVKTAKDGGLDVHFEVVETVGQETYTEKYHIESAKDIHPDLRQCFKDLRPIMGRVFGFTSFLTLMDTPDFKANTKQKDAGRILADEIMDKIDIRGISLSGQDDNVGVIITAVYNAIENQKVAINSPRIKFANIKYGFEEELETIIANIETEVYQFLFKGKKAQLSLFGDDGEALSGKDAAAGESEGDEGELFPDVGDPATDGDKEETEY